MATLKTRQSWQLFQGKHKNILVTASHRTHSFLELPSNTSRRFLRRLKAGSLKELSQEFSRTESRILGALSKLDEFFLNPQVRTLSGTVPGTSRNNDVENWEPTGDRSKNDPHPEVEFSACRTSNSIDSDPEETSNRTDIRTNFYRTSFMFEMIHINHHVDFRISLSKKSSRINKV